MDRRRAAFRLYLITDRKLAAARNRTLAATCEQALQAAVEAAPPGAVAVQLREKDLAGREIYRLALELRPICTRFGAPLLVNDRVDIAIAADADGVHLPADSFAIADARELLGPDRLIGVSTHTESEVRAAVSGGADFAVFGPVYAPLSKDSAMPPRGIAALRAACRAAATMPVHALGGITAERVRELGMGAGGETASAHPVPSGVAVIGAVFGAESPADAVRSILAALITGLR